MAFLSNQAHSYNLKLVHDGMMDIHNVSIDGIHSSSLFSILKIKYKY